jgi:hypothetical protein
MIALGIYARKSDGEHPKKPHTGQVHSILAALGSSSRALQSAASAGTVVSCGACSEALGALVVITHEDGSASSRLTS